MTYCDDTFPGQWTVLELAGAGVRSFSNYAFSSDVEALATGQGQKTRLNTPQRADPNMTRKHNNPMTPSSAAVSAYSL